jgi:glycosyltransferase involved in cell wall biosynthesis
MISVLIPIYNGIEFIDTSVMSVVNQTFTDWELIIGVNGHEENSSEFQIAKKYAEQYDNIRVLDLYQIKQGKATTLNEMVKYAQYEYIAILDVDDIWEEMKLDVQSIYIDMDYDVIGTRCVYFEKLEGTIPKIPVGDISNHDFKSVNPIINSSSIIKKHLCRWEENGIEDYDLWLRLRYKNNNIRFYNCNDILVKHRIHERSAFNSKRTSESVSDLLKRY